LHNPTTFTVFAPMTNNHKIVDYDAVLDAKFGKEGTPERARAEEAAYSFYSGQIIQDARKEAKMCSAKCFNDACSLKDKCMHHLPHRGRQVRPLCGRLGFWLIFLNYWHS